MTCKLTVFQLVDISWTTEQSPFTQQHGSVISWQSIYSEQQMNNY